MKKRILQRLTSMGVPSFFRWLARRYPKIMQNVIEEYPKNVEGQEIPPDTSKPNPNGIEFDCLYIDVNGTIHPASKGGEGRRVPESDDERMANIKDYMERIFSIVRPRRLVYLAVDGVAPRAKMNQQRGRRFRTAKEAKQKIQIENDIVTKLISEGQITQDDVKETKTPWDGNQITPGTPYMEKVAQYLRYMVIEKITNDPGWKNVAVIISDANVPGEGEHKLMEYIRYQHSMPGYSPNTRHCICGLDADLIMLALASHEPNFSLIREDVLMDNYQKNRESQLIADFATTAERYKYTPYQFMHLNVLREYLENDLKPDVAMLPFVFDLERIIDDFVFICFFVGNDFLPHLPSLEIREGAIDLLCRIYKKILPVAGGYLTENGKVDFTRVQMLMEEIAPQEENLLIRKKLKDERYQRNRENRNELERKLLEKSRRKDEHSRSQGLIGGGKNVRPPKKVNDANAAAAARLRALFGGSDSSGTKIEAIDAKNKGDSQEEKLSEVRDVTMENTEESGKDEVKPDEKMSESENAGTENIRKTPKELIKKEKEKLEEERLANLPEDEVQLGVEGWKKRYYKSKFGVDLDDSIFFTELTQHYAEGLQWVMYYYYQGCCSWEWYYPYHYPPFTGDLIDIAKANVDFSKPTVPFTPFQQLLAVLPAASSVFLPESYAQLMSRDDSPIIDFYPEDFKVDLNGKRFEWQGVTLLPFIDENRLFSAIKGLDQSFTNDEKSRNSRGNEYIFVHRDHPIAEFIKMTNESKTRTELDGQKCEVFGFVTADSLSAELNVGQCDSPVPIFPNLLNHTVVCGMYNLPSLPGVSDDKEFIFKSQLREGLVMPKPVLTPWDFQSGCKKRFFDFSNRNGRGRYGRGGNFRGGNFRGGNYRGGNFRGGNFRGDNLHGGNYRGGNFPGGNFHGGAVLRSPAFHPDSRDPYYSPMNPSYPYQPGPRYPNESFHRENYTSRNMYVSPPGDYTTPNEYAPPGRVAHRSEYDPAHSYSPEPIGYDGSGRILYSGRGGYPRDGFGSGWSSGRGNRGRGLDRRDGGGYGGYYRDSTRGYEGYNSYGRRGGGFGGGSYRGQGSGRPNRRGRGY